MSILQIDSETSRQTYLNERNNDHWNKVQGHSHDIEQSEGHEGFLSIKYILLINQNVGRESYNRDLLNNSFLYICYLTGITITLASATSSYKKRSTCPYENKSRIKICGFFKDFNFSVPDLHNLFFKGWFPGVEFQDLIPKHCFEFIANKSLL